MAAKARRILAVAARQDQLCALYMLGEKIEDWCASRQGGSSAGVAVLQLRRWYKTYQPEILISENPDTATRKGEKNINILKAIAAESKDYNAPNFLVTRQQRYKNLYEEAEALAERYPDLAPKLKEKPQIWESEPRDVIYFEALSMALQVLNQEQRLRA